MWQRVDKSGLVFYEAEEIRATGLVSHAFTTRHGGSGRYPGLNLGLHVDDDPDAVVANRSDVCRALGCGLDDLIACDQVHGTRIAVVDRSHAGLGADDYSTALPQTDGVITAVPGVMLSLYFADCVPVLLLDPVTPAIGLAHAGWKGTAGRIAMRALEAMHREFGTSPADCLAAVGPSIGPCCYEVDEPVAKATTSTVEDGGSCVVQVGDRYMLDLPGINARQLAQSGAMPHNIITPHVCTRCNAEDFFSYRREGFTGRMGIYVMLSSTRPTQS